jgi:hypothetical protein
MSTMVDEVSERVKAGRETISSSLDDMKEQIEAGSMTRIGIAGALAMLALAVGVGLVVYRQRRRRTLAERLQGALPDQVRELPGGIRVRLKRAL